MGALQDRTGSEVEDARLANSFRAAWLARAEELADSDDLDVTFADMLGVNSERVIVISHGSALVVNLDGELMGKWPSEAAFVADVAADRELSRLVRQWSRIPIDRRSEVVHALRALLDECPTCHGPVELSEETVESCCRSKQVLAATCEDCGARLLEVTDPR